MFYLAFFPYDLHVATLLVVTGVVIIAHRRRRQRAASRSLTRDRLYQLTQPEPSAVPKGDRRRT